MAESKVGLLGATGLVGKCLIPLLIKSGMQVCAFSRQPPASIEDGVAWRNFSDLHAASANQMDQWICVAPIWVLPEYFPLLETSGIRRVVALSSTSRFTKEDSTNPEERAMALRLADAEERIQMWAENRGVEWVILRPTLIYGYGIDKNIAEIARFIRRFHFFPLLDKAKGLRQPIHASDVAAACMSALQMPSAANRAYSISGGETVTYREMVTRIFAALERRPRLLIVPLWIFHIAVVMLRRWPRYQQWSTAMAERMNSDLVFDCTEARRDFGFNPRSFVLLPEDVAK